MSILSPVTKKEPSGCKLPGVRILSMINMMEKVSTRVNTLPLLKFFARIRLFFTCDPRNREVFELQTVLQSVREFARSL